MLKINISFGGFYESLHSSNIDNMIDDYFDEENYDSDNIDYSLIHKAYSKGYVSFLNEYLKDIFDINASLEFISLDSPREYNFKTDEIIINISDKNIKDIINSFSKDESCISYITDVCKSRSGFISFYNTYKEVIDDEEIHLNYIFQYINSINDNEFGQYYDFNNMYELLHSVDFLSSNLIKDKGYS